MNLGVFFTLSFQCCKTRGDETKANEPNQAKLDKCGQTILSHPHPAKRIKPKARQIARSTRFDKTFPIQTKHRGMKAILHYGGGHIVVNGKVKSFRQSF